MGPDAMLLVFFLMLSFKPAFSVPSFTCIKRLFSSSLLSAIRVISSAYLRLDISPSNPSTLPLEHIGHLLTLGAHIAVSYLSAFSYCSWGSRGKNTGVGCHFLLQWTTFCQNSLLWPVSLGWPCMAWLIELLKSLCHDKAVIHEGAFTFMLQYLMFPASHFNFAHFFSSFFFLC